MKRGLVLALAIGVVIGLPTLGVAGLVDPWETHYAEVAREMLARHDFISPWWANEGWFVSKPVLTFWLEAISMWLFRVDPSSPLSGHPEWAVRFPAFVFALGGAAILYAGIARTSGRRAALLGTLVLWTMPGYALLSHQALTDAPMIGAVAASLGFVLLAASTEEAPRKMRIALALIVALVMLFQLSAVLLAAPLRAGSPHSCGLPGQPACVAVALAHPQLKPLLQVALWAAPTSLVIDRVLHAKRTFALAAWTCAAIAAMAKGPIGIFVPAAAVVSLVIAQRSLRPLWRFELLGGLGLAVVLIGPWYLAVYARHGRSFIDQLVLHHMIGRTLEHLHDTNEGETVGLFYFVRQLGYATFPWSGLAAVSLSGRKSVARIALVGAALATFALVTAMKTKYHHYILPALPPLAMLTGIELDRMLRRPSRWKLALAALITAYVGREAIRRPASFILLLSYRYSRAWASTTSFTLVITLVAVVVTLAILASMWRRQVLLVLGGASLIFALLLVGLYLPRCAADGGQRDLIAAYYHDRTFGPPLVAYQLNWKGENFYTANDVAIFIASGAPMKSWLAQRHANGDDTFYFVTERGRVPGLERELGKKVTEVKSNAEFSLVRATL